MFGPAKSRLFLRRALSTISARDGGAIRRARCDEAKCTKLFSSLASNDHKNVQSVNLTQIKHRIAESWDYVKAPRAQLRLE